MISDDQLGRFRSVASSQRDWEVRPWLPAGGAYRQVGKPPSGCAFVAIANITFVEDLYIPVEC
jgi:hypothetical protein